ncbi:hypothetical protein FOA43_001467 [Brettanomyces nanus]|uniref:Uncharacterized protein n=1 Tax=Eeniella nana TaxID=13502 RepID=A0A875RZQ3_EENNA|nr:uncharacterized protein FOA43_001467 [Brettanomyces nanus]QPG74143.1 hypothetical protein FOA43_001467 [Brettanomyces nanus]
MAFLFKRSPKTPKELVRALNEQVAKLDTSSDPKKVQEEVTRYLQGIRTILSGDNTDSQPQPDQLAQLAHEFYATDALYLLLQHFEAVEFDTRKTVVFLFTSLLRRKIGNRSPTVDYLMQRPNILSLLLKGPENPDISLNMGSMLRESIRYEQIARIILGSENFWKYFEYCTYDSFETSTDAFSILSELLTVHKKAAADFFAANMNQFIESINRLIVYPNYVTKRESIKLLSQLILTKANYSLLTTYVSSPHNLKLIMILLGDKSKNIQLEAFNIFKVFVANPRKTKAITDILVKNRDILLEFLPTFNTDRKYDDLFVAEKTFVIEQIEKLPKIVLTTRENTPLQDSQELEEHQEQALKASYKISGELQVRDQPMTQISTAHYSDPKSSAQNVYANTKRALASGGGTGTGSGTGTTAASDLDPRSGSGVAHRETPISSSSPPNIDKY